MDQSPLVTEQIDEGLAIIDACLDRGIHLAAAAWIKPAEDGHWYLYLATDIVEDRGLAAAYKEVLMAIRGMPPLIFFDSLDDLKVIGATNPITRDLLATLTRYPAPLATWYKGNRLGSISIDEAYIYPATRLVLHPA